MDFDLYTISVKGFVKNTFEVFKNDQLVYVVKPKGFLSATYQMLDLQGNLLIDIKWVFSLVKFKYDLYDGDGHAGSIIKKTFSNTYIAEAYNGNYRFEGNFWSTNFNVFYNDENIARISRKPFNRKNAFGIAIKEGMDNELLLSMLIGTILIRKRKQAAGS